MNEHYVEIVLPDEHTITVRSSGDGKPIILLHGFPLDSSLWQETIGPLVDHGYQVVCPDLRGFGRSGVIKAPVSIGDLAMDVEHVRRIVIGSTPIVLCGLSLGGYVALEYWHRFRSNLSRLILCNTKPQADTEEAKATRQAMGEKAINESTWAAVSPMLEKLLTGETRETNGAVTQQVKDMMTGVPPATVAQIQSAMATRRDFTELLGQFDLPTLVITGQYDPISPPDDNRLWSSKLPHGRLSVIEGAAHLTPLEAPEEFNQVLIKFLS